jgi:hypothetical protein
VHYDERVKNGHKAIDELAESAIYRSSILQNEVSKIKAAKTTLAELGIRLNEVIEIDFSALKNYLIEGGLNSSMNTDSITLNKSRA